MDKKKILYIEDDKDTQLIYSDFLKRHFGDVILAENGQDGLEKFIEQEPDIVITDIRMPDMNGVEMIHAIRKISSEIPIMVFSAYTNEDFITESLRPYINGYITKPASNQQLMEMIGSLLGSANSKPTAALVSDEEPNQTSPIESSDPSHMYVVGIGASAGGLEALSALVGGLPHNSNMTYIIAQHLSPAHKTMLVELLGRETKLEIKNAEHGETLCPDVIYVTPPNNNIEIDGENHIILSAPEQHSFLPKPSVNTFFISLAKHKKEHAVGIILSGTGSDGAQGMRAINIEGGITMVQDPESAKYDGMPLASINGSNVDIVMDPSLMGQELFAFQNFPREKILQKYQSMQPEDEMQAIFYLLQKHKKVDFSLYKKGTIARRIERRMVAIKVDSLDKYIKILEQNAKEVDALYKDILIGVTSFFRDPEAYHALEEAVIHYLETIKMLDEFRIWMPGASTGEEAYSVVITLKEIFEKNNLSTKLRIFATDIDENALKIARKGLYSETSIEGIDEKLLKKYFNIHQNQFEIKKNIRENVIFSYHNLLADPSFKHLDLVICRNLLIYFNNEAQKYIMPMFHFSLKEGALLFLGKSENTTTFENLFAPIDKRNKIFKTILSSTRQYVPPPISRTVESMTHPNVKHLPDEVTIPIHELVIQEASKILMPRLIVTNEHLDVIYKKGDFDYITVPEGYVTYNLLKMIHSTLTIDIRTLSDKAKHEGIVQKTHFIPMSLNDEMKLIQIYTVPIKSKRSTMLVFYFHELESHDIPNHVINITDTKLNTDQILEIELNRTKEHMQTLVEELETTNEELQSSNEELQSSNEELQSTNEELETSNEELQSTNEELQTAYSELKELYRSNTSLKEEYFTLSKRYEQVLNTISDAIIVANLEGLILFSNRAMQELTGLNKEQLITKSLNDLALPQELPLLKKRHSLLLSNKRTEPFILKILSVDKTIKTVLIKDYVITDQEGNVRVWSFISDITSEQSILSALSLSEKKYEATFQYANIGIAHVDLEGKFLKVNFRFSDILGFSNEELLGHNYREITYVDDLEEGIKLNKNLLDGKIEKYTCHKRYYKKDRDDVIWAQTSVSLVRDENNVPLYYIKIIEDVTELKNMLLLNEQTRIVFETVQESIIITNPDTTIIRVNPAFEMITGFKSEEVIGKRASILKSGKYSNDFYHEILHSLQTTGYWSGEIINRTKDGELYPAFLNISPVRDENRNITQYIGVMTDISLLKQSQDKIQFLANHDTLTQLPNRSLLQDRLLSSIEKSRRRKAYFAVLFIDLDRFKIINDGLGHHIGDMLLIEVAARIQKVVREEDTVARIGGDEFVVLLGDLESPIYAGRVAQNLINSLARPIYTENHTLQIGASIGISIYPSDGNTPNELLRTADVAMYEAKKSGRNTFRFTSEELSTDAFEKATMEHAIRDGLNKNEFEIHYQPIIDINTRQLSHMEALIRWNHPHLGLVSPSKFIPIAEESNLIVSITEYVLYDVLSTLSTFEIACPISINFSLKDLESEVLYDHIKKYLHDFKLSGEQLIIEITERQFIDDKIRANRLLDQYQKLGMRYAMDDFGTGYSNLGYMIDMPFETLKIDRAFVSKIGIDKKGEEMVKATIAIAKALALTTVAEGIETKEQYEFLKSHGCDYAQGFYIQRPKPIKDLISILDHETVIFEQESERFPT